MNVIDEEEEPSLAISINNNHSDNTTTKSSSLCEYYLWVRWCNIREINGYYIYNGMKGNKLSFVHQQNSHLSIYFHNSQPHNHNEHHTHPFEQSSFSFMSTQRSSFLEETSIPEHREQDNLKLDLLESRSPVNTSTQAQTFPMLAHHDHLNPGNHSLSSLSNSNHSNASTPCSSPPPEHSPYAHSTHAPPWPLLHQHSGDRDEHEAVLHNKWVITHEDDILYFSKDKDDGIIIDTEYEYEYPPSYGWTYNERNQSSLPKSYLERRHEDDEDEDGGSAAHMVNFATPAPGITRIAISPQPMITKGQGVKQQAAMVSPPASSAADRDNNASPYKNKHVNGSMNVPLVPIPTPFDLPVQIIDIVFEIPSQAKQSLGFAVSVDAELHILQINKIDGDSTAYHAGLKQGDIIIAVNEEEIGSSAQDGMSKLENCEGLVTMTVCRRIFDHIMIVVKQADTAGCNGKYYFHHLDEYDSPVFMQDLEQEQSASSSSSSLHHQQHHEQPMIIRKAHYENETGECLWTISDKHEDYYIGLSMDVMPPNDNWEAVPKSISNQDTTTMTTATTATAAPTLIFYHRNEKMNKNPTCEDREIPMNKSELIESFSHPSKSYHAPATDGSGMNEAATDRHYRKPSWKKNETPWDILSDENVLFSAEALTKHGDDDDDDDSGIDGGANVDDGSSNMFWRNKYKRLEQHFHDMKTKKSELEQNAVVLYDHLQDANQLFYNYWLINKQQRSEIDALKETLDQYKNRFVLMRKELFEQKQREEELAHKINSMQTHSKKVSDLSALFDNEHKFEILQRELEHEVGDETAAANGDELETFALETEVNDLRVQLQAKELKIRELEIEVNSWQATHSQIYDSFTAATKVYREQISEFNAEQKRSQQKREEMETHLSRLQAQIDGNTSTAASVVRTRVYNDIDAELRYNSDTSTSESDGAADSSDDEIGGSRGGGSHARRSSKPWMNIQRKLRKQNKKYRPQRDESRVTDRETSSSPPPPIIKKKSSGMNLQNGNGDGAALNLKAISSGAEVDEDADNETEEVEAAVDEVDEGLIEHDLPSLIDVETPDEEVMIDNTRIMQMPSASMMPQFVNLSAMPTPLLQGMLTPELSASSYSLPEMKNMPMLNHHNADSKNSIYYMSKLQLQNSLSPMNADASSSSLLERDVLELRFENEQKMKQIEMLQLENSDIVQSKLRLLKETNSQITKLQQIVNGLLHVCDRDDVRRTVVTMLKSV